MLLKTEKCAHSNLLNIFFLETCLSIIRKNVNTKNSSYKNCFCARKSVIQKMIVLTQLVMCLSEFYFLTTYATWQKLSCSDKMTFVSFRLTMIYTTNLVIIYSNPNLFRCADSHLTRHKNLVFLIDSKEWRVYVFV